jgi:hypothetical protein
MVRKIRFRQVCGALLVTGIVAAGLSYYSKKQERGIAAAGGDIYYEWTGPAWLYTVWKGTGIGFGYAKVNTVEFSDQDISDEEIGALDLRHIESLVIESQSLTSKTARILAGSSDLRTLMLLSKEVDDDWVAAISASESLEHLVLRGSHVTDRSIDSLLAMKKLRNLDIGFTKVTARGARRLTEKLALTRVHLSIDQTTDEVVAYCKNRNPRIVLIVNDSIDDSY